MNSPRTLIFFLLDKLYYGAPGQIIGNSKDKLDMHIIIFPHSLISNVGSDGMNQVKVFDNGRELDG